MKGNTISLTSKLSTFYYMACRSIFQSLKLTESFTVIKYNCEILAMKLKFCMFFFIDNLSQSLVLNPSVSNRDFISYSLYDIDCIVNSQWYKVSTMNSSVKDLRYQGWTLSSNALVMYSANVKDSENAARWLASQSSSMVH